MLAVLRLTGLLRVGDKDSTPVRVVDRHTSRGRREGHEEPRRDARLHHSVQGEVRHSNNDAGTQPDAHRKHHLAFYQQLWNDLIY